MIQNAGLPPFERTHSVLGYIFYPEGCVWRAANGVAARHRDHIHIMDGGISSPRSLGSFRASWFETRLRRALTMRIGDLGGKKVIILGSIA
jgi:hypothetical protein